MTAEATGTDPDAVTFVDAVHVALAFNRVVVLWAVGRCGEQKEAEEYEVVGGRDEERSCPGGWC